MRAAIENGNKALNQFPVIKSASNHLSPLTIMTGKPNIEFGAYAHVYETNDPTNNTMHSRTMGAIALGATGNNQGGQYFYL